MKHIKIWMCFVLALTIIHICSATSKSTDNYNYGGRFKSIKCQTDNRTLIMRYCYLKALSRAVVILNIGLTFAVPYTKPYYVQLILNYRYGTIFREVIDSHQQEWCGIMSGAETHQWIEYIIGYLRKSAAALYHKCPYVGDLDLKNVTIDTENYNKHQSRIFPEGTYRLDVIIFQNEAQTGKFSVSLENKSPVKESFG